MRYIPLDVVFTHLNKTYEGLGAMHHEGHIVLLPNTKPDEVVIYMPLFPEGLTLKGGTVHYVSLLEACADGVEYEYEEEEDEQGEEGIEPVPE